jgi:hypothetical protein
LSELNATLIRNHLRTFSPAFRKGKHGMSTFDRSDIDET